MNFSNFTIGYINSLSEDEICNIAIDIHLKIKEVRKQNSKYIRDVIEIHNPEYFKSIKTYNHENLLPM